MKIINAINICKFPRRNGLCGIISFQLSYFYLQEKKATGKKNPPSRPLNMIVKVKPQVKKARIDQDGVEESSETTKTSPDSNGNSDKSKNVAMSSLVSYSDESEEDA